MSESKIPLTVREESKRKKPPKQDCGDPQWKGKTIRRLPQPQQLTLPITKSSGGVGTQFCVRITLSFCACGALVGFCLLVAGGVGKNHLANIKVLMYIGILMFLVCVILLVILCSSYDIFNIHPLLQAARQKPQCLCNNPTFDADMHGSCTSHVAFPYVHYPVAEGHLHNTIPPQFYHQPYRDKCGNDVQIPSTISVQNNVIKFNQKEATHCTVKNCVCLMKNAGGHHLGEKGDCSRKKTLGMNNVINEHNISRLCYPSSPQSVGGNPFYAIQAGVHGLGGNRVPSAVMDNFPLQMYNQYREDSNQGTQGSRCEKSEESSRL